MKSFVEFGLLPSLLKTLKFKNIHTPTEIQKYAIPLMMSGQSVVGVSETGSGKTLTYALPLLHLIKSLEDQKDPVVDDRRPRALVMVPTRDLGEQVSKVFKTFTHDTRLRVRPALGGQTFEQTVRNTSGPFEILLATPGRLLQLMQQNRIDLSDVRVIVFDEADQMLDKGFLSDSKEIVSECPKDIPLALFSATVSANVETLIEAFMNKAEVIKSSGSGKVVKTLVTQNEIVIDGVRWPLFEKVLKKKVEGGTIIFTNTREQCDRLAQEMEDKGYRCVIYRGEMDPSERRTNLKKFRSLEVDLLVSTDLAGRGLDLDSVGRVINYHLPKQMDNYLHRAGRTARAGRKGLVVNLVTERDLELIAALEGKGKSPKDLKERFKDKDGKRLHLPEDQRKAKPQKAKAVGSTKKPARRSKPPAFKPKPLPSEATLIKMHGRAKAAARRA